ncbi:MAG: AAA family ATPase [Lachnospiraceae bacterium]|nr:AAA family ATPase [Lachnospiraceae bacterium]
MKQLIVIIGPNGTGKSTTAKTYVEQYPQTAYVDSDWCRVMNPFDFTEITQETITENIYCLLHNYLTCNAVKTVIFTYGWHGPRKKIYDSVIAKLKQDGIDFNEVIIVLKCSKDENIKRAIKDGGDESRVNRGMEMTFSFYDEFDYPIIDTTNMTPSQAATEIHNLVIQFGTNNTWGKQVIEKALAYASYEWTATKANVLHGTDTDGRFVDTPDITWRGEVLNCGWWKINEVNVGIPYSWGNASTLEEFEQGIKNGKYAGNVPEDKKRYGSRNTVGVDCSGLLTICWELPKKIATRDIPEYATIIENLEDIKQGDVFAKPGSHVMFFKEFANTANSEVIIIDATRSTGKVSERTENVAQLFKKGYKIYRKI